MLANPRDLREREALQGDADFVTTQLRGRARPVVREELHRLRAALRCQILLAAESKEAVGRGADGVGTRISAEAYTLALSQKALKVLYTHA